MSGLVLVGLQALATFIGGFVLLVVLNCAWQLVAPRDATRPPKVFHFVPWVGAAVSYGMDPMGFLEDCRRRHGNVFTYHMLGRNITAALGPLGSNLVFNGKLANVNAEKAYTHLTTPVFGTEVVYDVPNAVLMEQKKMVKFGLTTENFKRYVGLIRGELLDFMGAHIFEGGKKRSSVDAFKTMSEITILTATATLQGHEVRAAMDKSFAGLYHDLDGGFTPLNFVFPNLPLPSYRRRDVAQKKMSDFYQSILRARRESGEEPPLDMLTALSNQTYKNGDPLTDKQIAHMMIALLMAGQHTSAATSAWAVLRLGESPALQEELYAEQVDVHGDGHGGFNELTYENLSTPKLSALIKEVLRMHPPLHSLMRCVIADYEVPTTVAAPSAEPGQTSSWKKSNEGVPYVIPKDSFILAAPGFSQLDEAIWGADAKQFSINRWLGEEGGNVPGEEDQGEEDYGFGKISKGGKSAYLPFGAGRHRCIGEQFANVQLGTLLATMIREMTWKLDQKFPGNDYTTMIVMPEAPRNVTFVKREKA